MFWQIHLLAVTSAGSASIWRAGLREIVTLTGMILVSSPLKEYDKRIEILTSLYTTRLVLIYCIF